MTDQKHTENMFKVCPFCNVDDCVRVCRDIPPLTTTFLYFARCCSCDARGPCEPTEQKAMERWETATFRYIYFDLRAQFDELTKQRDKLRNTVETVVDFMWVSNEAKIVRKLGWILQILKDVLTKTKVAV